MPIVAMDPKAVRNREAIVRRATDLFCETDDPTITPPLLASLRLNASTIARLFGSEQELLAEVRQRYRTEKLEKLTQPLTAECPMSGLGAMLDEWAWLMSDERRHKWFLVRAAVKGTPSDVRIATEISHFWRQLEDKVVRMLADAQDAGNLPPDKDPKSAARFILAVMRGMSVAGGVTKDQEKIRDVAGAAIAQTLGQR